MSVKNREKRIENLQRSNKESHRLIVDSLRQALYTMLKTRDIDSIKVVDLVSLPRRLLPELLSCHGCAER